VTTAERIAQLSPRERELLMQRLKQKSLVPKAPETPRTFAGNGADFEPRQLSYAQERMYFHRATAGDDTAHILCGALELEGELAVDALAAALREIVLRHEVLRTTFPVKDGQLQPSVGAPGDGLLRILDLCAVKAQDRDSRKEVAFREEATRPFSLGEESPFRALLIRMEPHRHDLVLALHHIAGDGWSIGLVLEELTALYTAQQLRGECSLAPLPMQYHEFAAWQRRRIESPGFGPIMEYWKSRLAEPPAAVRLRPDASEDPAVPPAAGASLSRQLGVELSTQMQSFSASHGTTPFALLLTVFYILLARCTGQEDLIVGSPVSGRDRADSERLVGVFVNTLALRVTIQETDTVEELLQTVRERVLEGIAHGEAPYEQVVHALQTKRGGAAPLFDVLFNFAPVPARSWQWPGIRVNLLEAPVQGSEFSMQMQITEERRIYSLCLLYRPALYTRERVELFLDQFHHLLVQILDNPRRTLGSLMLDGNKPQPFAEPIPKPQLPRVVESIRDWASRTPNALAVRGESKQLTYIQFWQQVQASAVHLQCHGVVAGEVVAVSGPRSVEMAVAMAAVLAVGAVLLTLSEDLPEQRRLMMLEEAQARFLWQIAGHLVPSSWQDAMPGLVTLRFMVDGTEVLHDLTLGSGPGAAYLFFTSGSTGRPKGVLGTHEGLAHFLAWQRAEFRIGPGDRCAHLTGLSFDVVLRDIFLPLTSGATLVVPSANNLASPGAVLDWLQMQQITSMHTVPSVVDLWLAQPSPAPLSHLKRLFFAGEPLTSALIERFRKVIAAECELINLYGPTETTLAKCFYRVPRQMRAGVQPLGKPLPQTQVLILSPAKQCCAIGEPGEIAIRTPFRSAGYWNVPEEQARRFIRNPFSEYSDDLLYLTGDRGAFTVDGNLEFLGRMDFQVKVHGVRVEPEEVAARLREHPQVAAVVVLAESEERAGVLDTRLIAYVMPQASSACTASVLRAFLRKTLPDAMVPSSFVFVKAMPLTVNGKVDRKRLQQIRPTPEAADAKVESPRNATEEALLRLWQEILPAGHFGVTQEFFDLGGHSLLAMRMLMRVEHQFGRRLVLSAFLKQPTIWRLAEILESASSNVSRVVELWSGESAVKLFLVHSGGGALYNYMFLVRHLGLHIPVYGFQARGIQDDEEPHDRVEAMSASYLVELKRLQPEGPYLLCGHSLGGMVAFEMAARLRALGDEVAFLGLIDSPRAGVADQGVIEKIDTAKVLAGIVQAAARFTRRSSSFETAAIEGLPEEEQVRRVVAELSELKMLPREGLEQWVRRSLKTGRAHVAARRAYQPQPADLTVTYFRAEEESPSDAAEWWSRLSRRGFEQRTTPGDHVTVLAEPHVLQLSVQIKACLKCLPLPNAGRDVRSTTYPPEFNSSKPPTLSG
jgi:amino acid adenylation domain-containing protein